MTADFIFRILVALVLALVWYGIDRRFGVRWYRWWYDMTHEHPMTGKPDRGLVYNRPSRVRGFWAVMIATFVTLLSLLNGGFRPLSELALWAASVPAAFLGLQIGPGFYGLWQKRDAAFNAVDKWERGEVDISDELKARTAELGTRLRRTITSEPDKAQDSPEDSPSAPPSPSSAGTGTGSTAPSPGTPSSSPAADLEAQDPQELVNRYLNRGQSGNRE